jgi:predicted ATPase
MKIEAIEIHNYKVLQNVKIENIGNMAVFLGENGVEKCKKKYRGSIELKQKQRRMDKFYYDSPMKGLRTLSRRGSFPTER